MQKILHKADTRGVAEHGWLHSRFSFSFAEWYEPTRMGFGALRVINDDVIEPATGFGMHPHKDMEIITIVTQGAVTHSDDLGNTGLVQAGEVQVMSAGTGVVHSEYNNSPDTPLKLFQIWIEPKSKNIPPRYEQCTFVAPKPNCIQELVSPIGSKRRLTINQDAFISHVTMTDGASVDYTVKVSGNGVYFFVIDGAFSIADELLGSRDALGVSEAPSVRIQCSSAGTLLCIEVPL